MRRMRYIKNAIPSFITELNLVSGVISILLAFNGQVTLACYFVILAAVFDLFDGAAARLLNAVSEFGKQIDSLADVVSFGVAPSIILIHYVNAYVVNLEIVDNTTGKLNIAQLLLVLCFITPAVFGSLRLARYNITKSEGNFFQGMPIPSSALIILGLWFFRQAVEFPVLDNLYIILALTFAVDFLLVCKLPMLSLKAKGNTKQVNILLGILVVITILSIVFYKMGGVFITMIAYLIISFTNSLLAKNSRI